MTTGLHADDIAINRLRVKASSRDADAVERSLYQASWPRAARGSWVFLRQVDVLAPRNRLAETVTAQARRLMDTARGAGDNGQVIRFATFAELLSRLMTDLANGSASRRWYWQRWANLLRLPISQALDELMQDHAVHLSAVTAELSRTGTLSLVWLKLDTDSAHRLATQLARRSGVRLAQIPFDAVETEPMIGPVDIPDRIRRRWSAILTPLSAIDPRRLAALMLIGQEIAPLLLQKTPARLLAALDRSFSALSVIADPVQPKQSTVSTTPEATSSSDRAALPDIDTHAQPVLDETSEPGVQRTAAPSPIPPEPSQPAKSTLLPLLSINGKAKPDQTAQTTAIIAPIPLIENQAAKTQSSPSLQKISVPDEKHRPATPSHIRQRVRLETASVQKSPDSFDTWQGGLFYLLNFLNREDVQTMIRAYETGNDQSNGWASGWGWLYRLGRELALDETDPVTVFLARQLELENRYQLNDLPPLAACDQLLALAKGLYGRAGVWQPDLLRLQARVYFTPSHVDMYASMSDIRLAVRLAGLDINPGWLPWLGRVVTFHYEAL